MATQHRRSHKRQEAMEKEGEHEGPTNVFIGRTNTNVNLAKDGVGTIGDNNAVDARRRGKDTTSDNRQTSLKDLFGLWSLVTKPYRPIKRAILRP